MAGITVVQVHNNFLFSDSLNTLKHKCGQNLDFLKRHLILGKVTTGLQKAKSIVLLSSKETPILKRHMNKRDRKSDPALSILVIFRILFHKF